MDEPRDITRLFSKTIEFGYKQVLKFSLQNPAMGWFMTKTLLRFYADNHTRERWAKKGICVPPMIIFSITSDCNLDCQGCYARILHTPKKGDMSTEKLADIIDQADQLGVSVMMLAGGEPFKRQQLLNVTEKHPGIIFPIFTNGLLIDDHITTRIKKHKNVLPVISLEGYELETDQRRGEGVFEHARELIQSFNREKIYFGISITMTRNSYASIKEGALIRNLVDQGCKAFFLVNYLPVDKGSENLALTQAQSEEMNSIAERLRSAYPALFMTFPGGELSFGGCLAGGNGFIHINAEGLVEPCPFSPYTDADLTRVTLIEALKSPLLREIRAHSAQLLEADGICALWKKRDWVASLVNGK